MRGGGEEEEEGGGGGNSSLKPELLEILRPFRVQVNHVYFNLERMLFFTFCLASLLSGGASAPSSF